MVPVLGVPGQFWLSKLWIDGDGESRCFAPSRSIERAMVYDALHGVSVRGVACGLGLKKPHEVEWLVRPCEGLEFAFGRPHAPSRVLIDPSKPFMEQVAAIPPDHPARAAAQRLLASPVHEGAPS